MLALKTRVSALKQCWQNSPFKGMFKKTMNKLGVNKHESVQDILWTGPPSPPPLFGEGAFFLLAIANSIPKK